MNLAKTWEYLVLHEELKVDKQMEKLNRNGEKGWELVCVNPSKAILYLKRPVRKEFPPY